MSTSTISPEVELPTDKFRPHFYVVSVRKMAIMMLLTWGVYGIYWHYRNWATYKRATGDKVIPLLRAIFSIFFLYPLLKRIDRGLQDRGKDRQWSPGLLALGIILTILMASLLPGLLDPALNSFGWIAQATPEVALRSSVHLYAVVLPLFCLQIWLTGKIQRAINLHEGDEAGGGNNKISWVNRAWLVPGTLMWVTNMFLLMVTFWLVALF